MTATRVIVVIAGVIERDGRILMTRRLAGTHLAGRWEFPGGKCEANETHAECLRRELDEELGLRQVHVGDEIVVTEHAYPERTVRLHFLWCTADDEPISRLGQDIRWVRRDELRTLELPDADQDLVNILCPLPA